MGSLLMPAAARSFCTCEGLDRNRFTRKSRSGTRLQALATAAAPSASRHSINNWVNQSGREWAWAS